MRQGLLTALFLILFVVPALRLESAQTMVSPSGSTGNRGTIGPQLHGAGTGSVHDRTPGFAPSRPSRPGPPHHGHNPILIPDSSFRDRDVSVSIEQTQSAPGLPAEKAAAKKYYVPPRWVATDQGVEVLMPGFWTDDPKLAGMDGSGGTHRVLREY
jgi:hypothetical protein